MVFSSYLFLFYFLPVALAGYYLLARCGNRTLNYSLIFFGYIFYGWANPKFIFLMAATTVVDWLASVIIAHGTWKLWTVWREPVEPLARGGPRNRSQRWAIYLSVVTNLLSLGFFKYYLHRKMFNQWRASVRFNRFVRARAATASAPLTPLIPAPLLCTLSHPRVRSRSRSASGSVQPWLGGAQVGGGLAQILAIKA